MRPSLAFAFAAGLALVATSGLADAPPTPPPPRVAATTVVVTPPVLGAPATPDVVAPAPVPVQRAPEPPAPAEPATPVQRIHLQADPYTTLITEPPAIDDATASPELTQWRDYLQAKKDRRVLRGSEIGGPAAIGVKLGSKSQLAQVTGLDDAQRARLAEWNGEGALVMSTVPGSPAEKAGLLPGDVIIQYAGVWIDELSLFVKLASRSVIDREQEMWILRDGTIERTYVTPVDRHEMERL